MSTNEALIVKLVLRLYPMSLPSATDAPAAANDDFDRVSPRRLATCGRGDCWRRGAVWRIAEQVNAGVFGGRGKAALSRSLASSLIGR